MENPPVQRKRDKTCFRATSKIYSQIIKYFPTDEMQTKPSISLTAPSWIFPLHNSRTKQELTQNGHRNQKGSCVFPVNRDKGQTLQTNLRWGCWHAQQWVFENHSNIC